MDKISIILVNYESDKDTIECLESLKNIKHKDFEYNVLVVDNGSLEHFKLPKKLRSKRVEVVRSQKNLGFTGGNNLGLWYAQENYDPDYFLLLNNDTVVDPHFLAHIHQAAKDHLDVGLIGSKIYFYKGHEFHKNSYDKKELGNVLWFVGGNIDWPNLTAFHRGVDEVDRGHFDDSHQTDFVTGCSMLIPKSVFEKVGYLDKNYFLYLEDVDYSMRVKKAGYKLHVCTDSILWHKNAGSSGGSGSDTQVYYQNRNRLYFALKYTHWRIKLTAVRLGVQLLMGSRLERKAVIDLVLGNMGKQPLI